MDLETLGTAISVVGVPAAGALAWIWYRYAEKHRGTVDEYKEIVDSFRRDYETVQKKGGEVESRYLAEIDRLKQELETNRSRCGATLAELRQQNEKYRVDNEALIGRIGVIQSRSDRLLFGVHPVLASADLLSTACIVADQSGIVIAINPFVTFLLHWLDREIVGQPLIQVIPPRLRSRHSRAWAVAITREFFPGRENSLSTFALTKQGQEIPVTVRFTGWKDNGKWMFCGLITYRPGGVPGWDVPWSGILPVLSAEAVVPVVSPPAPQVPPEGCSEPVNESTEDK